MHTCKVSVRSRRNLLDQGVKIGETWEFIRKATERGRYEFAAWKWLRPNPPAATLAELGGIQAQAGLDHIHRPTFAARLIEQLLKTENAVADWAIGDVYAQAITEFSRQKPENLTWLSHCARTATLRTRQFFAEGLLDHYRITLQEIRKAGFVAYWRREFGPYLRAAAQQFSPSRQSLTERLLQRRSR